MDRIRECCGISAALAVAAVLGCATAASAASSYTLSGGNSANGAGTRYTAPGLANTYGPDFPAAGLGEEAAQLRMRATKLRQLRVSVVTSTAAAGSVTVTVRVNGAPTVLTCTVGVAGGNCGTPAGTSVSLSNGDRLAIEVVSDLDQGLWTFSYTLQST